MSSNVALDAITAMEKTLATAGNGAVERRVEVVAGCSCRSCRASHPSPDRLDLDPLDHMLRGVEQRLGRAHVDRAPPSGIRS